MSLARSDLPAARAPATRVLLVDEHRLVLEGLRLLIGTTPDLFVVGEARTPDDAIAAARREQPDIVVLDIDRDDRSGLDLLPGLRISAPLAKVIVLTGSPDAEVRRDALKRGARGLVLKRHASTVLLQAISRVRDGELWFERRLVAQAFDELVGAGQPHHS